MALKYHAAAYVSVNGTLVGIWALTGEGAFWPAWVLAPGTVMLGWHATVSQMLRRSLGLPGRSALRGPGDGPKRIGRRRVAP